MTEEELTRRVSSLEERTARHTEQIKTCFGQIGEVKGIAESVHKVATAVEVLAHDMRDTGSKVDKLAEDVEEIKDKPGKRWDSVVNLIITGVGSALIAWALAKAGIV